MAEAGRPGRLLGGFIAEAKAIKTAPRTQSVTRMWRGGPAANRGREKGQSYIDQANGNQEKLTTDAHRRRQKKKTPRRRHTQQNAPYVPDARVLVHVFTYTEAKKHKHCGVQGARSGQEMTPREHQQWHVLSELLNPLQRSSLVTKVTQPLSLDLYRINFTRVARVYSETFPRMGPGKTVYADLFSEQLPVRVSASALGVLAPFKTNRKVPRTTNDKKTSPAKMREKGIAGASCHLSVCAQRFPIGPEAF
ncbi:hypothetical protein MTO96_015445 [Rhipicephalus appendiculatus]